MKVYHDQEWQRVGFGPGFSISGPDPRVLNRGPNPIRLLNGFFSRGPDPPLLGYRVFSRGPDPPQPGPTGPAGPFRDWAQIVAQPKKKKKVQIFFFLRSSPNFFFFFHSSLHIPNKKIKPKFIFTYIQAYIFKFKPR